MANTYDEKILSSFGKRSTEANSSIPNGIFVVDPNKVINSDNNIIPRYVKQEDLVMYANLTARLNPDSAIVNNGDGEKSKIITIGQIGVNFMNPLERAVKNNDGTIDFSKKRNKGVFTTDWSDFFTTNSDQEGFFDPETFGITSIDVSHNASMTPIIKIEFVDVQGRTLLERGNDPTNPYNIFYRFPYPLFSLTIKGYYGKGIEYPLSMTKTSTTFDSSTGNYIIRAEFLSRTFSIYNNFLMVYAYLAPYMYQIGDANSGDYLGKRLLKGLYQKQNKKYEKKYGVTAKFVDGNWVVTGPNEKSINEFKKHQFVKYPSILDMIRTSSVLNKNELAYANELNETNKDRGVALEVYAKLEEKFDQAIRKEIPVWGKKLVQDKRNTGDYYLNENLLSRLNNGSVANLSNQTMANETGANKIDPYLLIREYSETVTIELEKFSGSDYKTSEGVNVNLKQNIINDIKLELTAAKGFKNETSYIQKLNSSNLKTIFNDDLILFNNTSLRDSDSLKNVYFSEVFFKKIHKIIIKNLINFFEKADSVTEDQLFFNLKEKIGFVPNIDNVIRILMNNMQVFLTLLNLSALNSFRQIKDDDSREKMQSLFGEYEIDIDNPDIKKFYPFPNYFQKELDIESNTYVFKKTYPGNKNTKHWFEVQFTEEIFRALTRMKTVYGGENINNIDPYDNQTQIYYENLRNQTVLTASNQIKGLISSLLVINNLNPYDTQQTPIETVYEFVDKLMLFSGFANTETEKINPKLIDMLATHEFSMLEDSVRNADKTSLSVFYTNINNKIKTAAGTTETYYDAFARTMAGSDTNSTGLVNNINNVIVQITQLLNKQYTITELNMTKQKIEGYINSATNLETFKTLYDYDPLEYKSRKNPNTPERLHAVFFNGLNMHDQIEGNDPNLSTLAAEIKANYTKPTKNTSGYLQSFDVDVESYPLDFKIDNKVSTNKENSNALAISVKTDAINPGLIPNKKIKDQTKYSKILI
jgi:hypothetical protein